MCTARAVYTGNLLKLQNENDVRIVSMREYHCKPAQ
jgi:hypothetical protein